MKKFKKVALLAASGALLAGGVSTAFAMTFTQGQKVYNDATDSAVVLSWGTNQVANVDNLTSTAYVYRLVVLSNPSTSLKTADITGNVKLTFTLAAKDSNVLTGCDVSIYQDTTIEAVQALNEEAGHVKKNPKVATPTKVVNVTSVAAATAEITVPVSTNKDVNFVLEFNYDGSDLGGATLGGSLSVVMDYVAA